MASDHAYAMGEEWVVSRRIGAVTRKGSTRGNIRSETHKERHAQRSKYAMSVQTAKELFQNANSTRTWKQHEPRTALLEVNSQGSMSFSVVCALALEGCMVVAAEGSNGGSITMSEEEGVGGRGMELRRRADPCEDGCL